MTPQFSPSHHEIPEGVELTHQERYNIEFVNDCSKSMGPFDNVALTDEQWEQYGSALDKIRKFEKEQKEKKYIGDTWQGGF